ncbi:MAG: FliH/SctL family protein [Bermanella sp.]
MIERRQRIPAEEVINPKSWNLPYWVEPEAVVKAREKEEAKAEQEVEIEEEEIEVEPLTAEQLENIRQDAYNEGLQQGLVEGRQKGEKLGAQEGRKEGLTAGTEEGRKLGFEAGNDEGKKQALEEGQQQTQQTVDDLQLVIKNLSEELSSHKNIIDDFLPELVTQLAQAVINEELSQGSEHIVALVNLALAALPVDRTDLSIELNSKDLPFLEAAFEQNNIQTQLSVHDEISAGGCKLVTSKSVADFTLEDRWGNVLTQYKRQLQLGLMQDEAVLDELYKDSAPEQIPEEAAQSTPVETPAENSEPQNLEPQNLEPQNSEPQNSEPQNSEPQNLEPQNSEPQNSEPEIPELENPEPENPDPQALAKASQDEPEQLTAQEPSQALPEDLSSADAEPSSETPDDVPPEPEE